MNKRKIKRRTRREIKVGSRYQAGGVPFIVEDIPDYNGEPHGKSKRRIIFYTPENTIMDIWESNEAYLFKMMDKKYNVLLKIKEKA